MTKAVIRPQLGVSSASCDFSRQPELSIASTALVEKGFFVKLFYIGSNSKSVKVYLPLPLILPPLPLVCVHIFNSRNAWRGKGFAVVRYFCQVIESCVLKLRDQTDSTILRHQQLR